jgi:glycogen synthase kinase 3 beta
MLDHFSSADEKDSYMWIVTELMPESLGGFLRQMHLLKATVHPLLVKLFAYQLFAGLAHLHSLGIAHRDIKTDNCLVDPGRGRLVISDFGSAKVLDKDEENAFYVASRIYRAPELLLNCTSYDNKIDIWAAGCVIAEILLDAIPMWQGSSNDEQLVQIMQVLGPPTREDIRSFKHPRPFPIVERISSLHYALPLSTPSDLLDLLGKIFQYSPKSRPTAVESMRSPYFDELFMDGVKLPSGNSLPSIPRRPS